MVGFLAFLDTIDAALVWGMDWISYWQAYWDGNKFIKMCKKTEYRSSNTQIDNCIRNLIKALKSSDHYPLASCCGHGKYPLSIIVKSFGNIYELMSGKVIFRKRKFYKSDWEGYYYIPEVSNERL